MGRKVGPANVMGSLVRALNLLPKVLNSILILARPCYNWITFSWRPMIWIGDGCPNSSKNLKHQRLALALSKFLKNFLYFGKGLSIFYI